MPIFSSISMASVVSMALGTVVSAADVDAGIVPSVPLENDGETCGKESCHPREGEPP